MFITWFPIGHDSVIVAMMVASILPFGFALLAKNIGGFTLKDNENPRVFQQRLTGMASRANAVQQNSYESLPLFLTSVVLAMLFFVPIQSVTILAWLYVLLRLIYGLAYLFNFAIFRSVIWFLSMLCPLLLMIITIRFV